MSIVSGFKKIFGMNASSGRSAAPREAVAIPSSVSTGYSTPAKGGNWFNGMGKKNTSARTTLKVYCKSGSDLELKSSDILTSGGEGTVYNMPGKNNILIKLYHDSITGDAKKISALSNRLDDMLRLGLSNNACLAWPRLAVFDSGRKPIGFAMNKCVGRSFYSLGGGPASVRQAFPKWDRLQLAQTALDFVTKVRQLARHGIFINDFNPNNFLVNDKCEVSFIDCDSFQVPTRNGGAHITRTYFASYVAPELLREPSRLARPRDIHQVEFGAAMIVFHLLMCGLHPYSYCDRNTPNACGSPEENLRNGRCPLGIGTNCRLPYGPRNLWYNLWSWLTGPLKQCFIQTFREGHGDPSRRASLDELAKALEQLIFEMERTPDRDVLGYAPFRRALEPDRRKPRGDKTDSSSGNAFGPGVFVNA